MTAGEQIRPVQPDPASYGVDDLAGWLRRAAQVDASPGGLAAVEFLCRSRTWLTREDWRRLCITVAGDGDTREAWILWGLWGGALESGALHHGDSARTVFEVARWLREDPFQLARLDLPNTRALLAAVAVACGWDEDAVGGVRWSMLGF